MPEHDALVLSFSHLKDFAREKEALHTLRKIASLVKPIMRARGWKVGELAEFFPDQHNLLGLNVNRGQRILLRLRHAGDRNQFLPAEQVTDTMLHELSHIVHGPHDAKFHALWNQLRDEHEGLATKGYTGEGFLSDGHRLGGARRVPMHEARRLARAAAEKRQVVSAGSGQRLGGSAPRPGQDIRNVIVSAVERRNRALQGCGNTNHNEREILEISDTATKNGFRTKAEEDAANDAAIAQALWELVQEDEKAKYGGSYIPPTQQNPTGNGGGTVFDQPSDPRPNEPGESTALPGRPSGSRSNPPPVPTTTKPVVPPSLPRVPEVWACEICTLHNPATYLYCDACGTERTAESSQELFSKSTASEKRPRTVVDLTSSPVRNPSGAKKSKGASAGGPSQSYTPAPPATWQCSFCGHHMERQWWTCSTCGKMKDNSK
ncbi:WLM domain-containing protein [Lasiosphaeria hispida]|uniref:WLM domain-containing protein n=1 Tax=Lasiosphaeria hispida TaxID=260671 RepID=A0AAJ0H699_9PEZI|nr:WLM domain-containing protein [Lasiosphaeria hispida]